MQEIKTKKTKNKGNKRKLNNGKKAKAKSSLLLNEPLLENRINGHVLDDVLKEIHNDALFPENKKEKERFLNVKHILRLKSNFDYLIEKYEELKEKDVERAKEIKNVKLLTLNTLKAYVNPDVMMNPALLKTEIPGIIKKRYPLRKTAIHTLFNLSSNPFIDDRYALNILEDLHELVERSKDSRLKEHYFENLIFYILHQPEGTSRKAKANELLLSSITGKYSIEEKLSNTKALISLYKHKKNEELRNLIKAIFKESIANRKIAKEVKSLIFEELPNLKREIKIKNVFRVVFDNLLDWALSFIPGLVRGVISSLVDKYLKKPISSFLEKRIDKLVRRYRKDNSGG